MLRRRLLTAAVVIAVLVPCFLLLGELGVVIIVSVFGGIALWEVASCLPALRPGAGKELTLAFGLAVVAAFHLLPGNAVMAAVVWLPLLILLVHLILFHRIERSVESASQMVLAVTYVMVPLAHAILIRKLEFGVAWIFFVLLVICLGDTGAYLAGKYKGKHRFSSSVSPSKTVEGLFGGFAGNLLGMLIVKAAVPGIAPFKTLFLLALILAVTGPVGDLVASMIKRKLDIKDFGSILPGHGGVMDRADSLIPALPLVYYFLVMGPWGS
jgi:phosphatidate cytidylyltransferase